MPTLEPEQVDKFPEALIFTDASTVCIAHIIKSDGMRMLTCDSAGEVSLWPLKSIYKISPRNNANHICHIDSSTGAIVSRSPEAGTVYSTGPVNGVFDASVNLANAAKALGFTLGELTMTAAGDKASVEHKRLNVAPPEPVKPVKVKNGKSAKPGRTKTLGVEPKPVGPAPVVRDASHDFSLDDLNVPTLDDF